jgi:chitin synthase
VAAIYLAIKGIESVHAAHDSVTGSSLWSDAVFRNIVLSLLATFGLYLVSSVLFVSHLPWDLKEHGLIISLKFEPWHMITSCVRFNLLVYLPGNDLCCIRFVQYLLLAPSYINVLNVYAVSFRTFLRPAL